jgi:predicted ATPase
LVHLPASQPAAADQANIDCVNRAHITLARILWLQGYPDQADNLAKKAITEATAFDHPVRFSMAVAWAFSVFFWNSELDWLEEHVDRLLLETRKHAMDPYRTIGQAAKGTILIQKGHVEAGLPMLRDAQRQRRSHQYGLSTVYTVCLAMSLARTGQEDEALSTIDEAIDQMERRQNLMDLPELVRVKAELLLSAKQPDLTSAETLLNDALDRARRQFSLGWELRTAISLARMWMAQARHDNARELLAPTLARFTEGFARSDIREATDLLHRLHPQLHSAPIKA